VEVRVEGLDEISNRQAKCLIPNMPQFFVIGVGIITGRLEWVLALRAQAAVSENPLCELLRPNFWKWR